MVSATVDADALRHNLDRVRALAPRARVMAVVKANAYGHGLVATARALGRADALAVARVEEGLTLRRAGIDARVVLLEGVFDREQLEAATGGDFDLVVHSPEQIALLREAAPPGARLRLWIKLDTGMNRLGFKEAEFAAAHAELGRLACIAGPVNLFTHFANADDPESPQTGRQLARFATATAGLPGERSLANSAALLRVPDAHADWVRPGLLLYGAAPFAGVIGSDAGLRPAMTLHSRVIAVKSLEPGECVGYGGDWVARRPTRLAIAAVGYGDGYPRSLPSGAPVLIDGRRAPLAGRVSMDMIGIDVTDLGADARPGDAVVLWGAGLPVEEVALWAQTIPYELLCGISQRVGIALR